MTGPGPLWWTGFLCLVFAMLAVDLGLFHRKAHVIGLKEALGWTVTWVTLALLFNAGIWMGWIGGYGPGARSGAALEFLTGYVLELSLSVDNVFVFALLFNYFHVPPTYRHRVLFWGILGALLMRGVMIFAGVALIQRFHWVMYIFGAILIYGGFKMWRASTASVDVSHNPLLHLVRRFLPVTKEAHGEHFFVRQNGALAATPLFVVLVLVEWTDLIFAIDSIPAVLAVTSDPFIVFTSNVLAILGLRSLYFTLAGVMERFHLLHYGLAAILVFVGLKMILADVYKVPILLALGVIAVILAISVIASLLTPPPPHKEEGEGGITGGSDLPPLG